MELVDNTTFFTEGTQGSSFEGTANLKRKNSCKLEALLSAKKRFGASLRPGKRTRVYGCKPVRDSKGTVVCRRFSPDISTKISSQNQDVCNFKKSGIPSRFMYYEKGEWKDFPQDAVAALLPNFKDGKPSATLSVNGERYLINFMQMMQLNMRTGFLRSIAWIDEHGKCFFPTQFLEGHGNQLLFQGRLDPLFRLASSDCDSLECKNSNSRQEVCNIEHSTGEVTGSCDSCHGALLGDCTVVRKTSEQLTSSNSMVGRGASGDNLETTIRTDHDFALLRDRLVKLEQGDSEFASIQNKFQAGLGMLAKHTTVVGIYRDSHTSTSGIARLQAFKNQIEITRQARGDAKERYAWHGTSKSGVSGIVLHGFGQPKTPKHGATYGVGVYLSPEDSSHLSAIYSDIDENGEQHMILCSVIMGNMEQVQPGSEQFHPGSEYYDTGVDDLGKPKRYIIWSTHMNTHILPQYVVSFKLSPQWREIFAGLRGKPTTGRNPSLVSSSSLSRWSQLDGHVAPERCSQPKVGDSVLVSLCQGEKDMFSHSVYTKSNLKKTPCSPWLSFPMLLSIMKKKLPPPDLTVLEKHYMEFKAGNTSREVLIRNIRAVAGDCILANAIRGIQAELFDGSLMPDWFYSNVNEAQRRGIVTKLSKEGF